MGKIYEQTIHKTDINGLKHMKKCQISHNLRNTNYPCNIISHLPDWLKLKSLTTHSVGEAEGTLTHFHGNANCYNSFGREFDNI